jgi:diaminopimelate epimerase
MVLSIIKCHGSGNDFVLIDETVTELFSEEQRPALARLLCDRSGILGADGVLFVQKSSRADARMRMFNADGSEAQTCGNGLRCVARFTAERLDRTSVSIETMKGVSPAAAEPEIAPGVKTYSVELGPFSIKVKDLPLIVDSEELINAELAPLVEGLPFTAVSAPNPHLIAVVEKIDIAELESLGKRASDLPGVLPERANVSFCRIVDGKGLAVATFERGSGLTQSCGSAMGASVLAACITGRLPFGDWLSVFNMGGYISARATKEQHGSYRVVIKGNATFVFAATLHLDLEKMSLGSTFDGVAHDDEIVAYDKIHEIGQEVMSQNIR